MCNIEKDDAEFNSGCFLHMARGSNWDNMSSEQFNNKIKLLKDWINTLV